MFFCTSVDLQWKGAQEEADYNKDRGNAALKANNFPLALEFYNCGLQVAGAIPGNFHQVAVLFSNRCYVLLKMGSLQMALQDARQAQSVEPTWHKVGEPCVFNSDSC